MTLATAKSSVTACWHLDAASGNETDVVASKVLVETSTPNSIASAVGKLSNARDFEAADTEYFALADTAEVSFADIDCCLAVWFWIESFGGVINTLVCKGNSDAGNREYNLSVASTGVSWQCGNGTGEVTVTKTMTVNTGEWYLAVVWHDATNNQIGISINAGTAATAAFNNGVQNGTGDLLVGVTAGAGGALALYHDGLIDELLFMKGHFLDSSEITELYNNGNGVAYENWIPAPTVTDCSPATGSTAGGTAVTLTGTGFLAGAAVTFGGTSATGVSVDSSTSITCTTPAHAAGTVDVVVTNTDTQSGTLTNGFTFASSGSKNLLLLKAG